MSVCVLSFPKAEEAMGVSYLKQYSVAETYELHGHSFYELVYICRGQCVHEINGVRQPLHQGAMVFIRPGDVHRFDFIHHFDMHIISCGLTPEVVARVCDYLSVDSSALTTPSLPPCLFLDGAACADMEKRLDEMGMMQGNERRKTCLCLLPELFRQWLGGTSQQPAMLPAWFARLLDAMNEPTNYLEGLRAMIRLANVSQEHLTRCFRRYLNMTPTEYINAKRINHACALLMTGDYSVTEVCYMSGFNHPEMFYRSFKKQYHCSPGQFLHREGMRGNA